MENQFRALLHRGDRTILVAHRGDSAYAPENTLEAAQRAWDEGADAWELDVQLSRDGVPVVLHDESLVRTTDVLTRFAGDPRGAAGFLVADFDFEEIRTLDAGSWFLEPSGGHRTASAFGTWGALGPAERARYASGAVRVPSLADALALTDRLDWSVNVELKSFPDTDPRLFEAAFGVIRRTGTASRVLISSFDHADVARATRLAPEVATGVLVATPVYRPSEYVREHVRADTFHPSAEVLGSRSNAYRRRPSAASLRLGDVEALRRDDVPVLVFTVNDSNPGGLASHLAEAGVSGFFTDDPRGLRALLGTR